VMLLVDWNGICSNKKDEHRVRWELGIFFVEIRTEGKFVWNFLFFFCKGKVVYFIFFLTKGKGCLYLIF
jgi:hypothetical protein